MAYRGTDDMRARVPNVRGEGKPYEPSVMPNLRPNYTPVVQGGPEVKDYTQAAQRLSLFAQPANQNAWTLGKQVNYTESKVLLRMLMLSLIEAAKSGRIDGKFVTRLTSEMNAETPGPVFKEAVESLINLTRRQADNGWSSLADAAADQLNQNTVGAPVMKLIVCAGGDRRLYSFSKRLIKGLPDYLDPELSANTSTKVSNQSQITVASGNKPNRSSVAHLTEQSCVGCRSTVRDDTSAPSRRSPTPGGGGLTGENPIKPREDGAQAQDAIEAAAQMWAQRAASIRDENGVEFYSSLATLVKTTRGHLELPALSKINKLQESNPNGKGLFKRGAEIGFQALNNYVGSMTNDSLWGMGAGPRRNEIPGDLAVSTRARTGGNGSLDLDAYTPERTFMPNGRGGQRSSEYDQDIFTMYERGLFLRPQTPLYVRVGFVSAAQAVGALIDSTIGHSGSRLPKTMKELGKSIRGVGDNLVLLLEHLKSPANLRAAEDLMEGPEPLKRRVDEWVREYNAISNPLYVTFNAKEREMMAKADNNAVRVSWGLLMERYNSQSSQEDIAKLGVLANKLTEQVGRMNNSLEVASQLFGIKPKNKR